MTTILNREYNWHAIYTKARSEKKAFEALTEDGIDTFLPLSKTLQQWKDRKKWVELPLFSSYIFVKVSNKEYYEALQNPYSVCYVTLEGKAVNVPDSDIESIKFLIEKNYKIDVTSENFGIGEKVMVKQGQLAGMHGELLELRGKHKVLLRIDAIGQSLVFDVPIAHLVKE
ncbi:MAG: UpxY family transcription antiterminator [Bacteroidetes bacterium]|jgi:transcriptional antiterminator RfaH|nr:UpxY family transcription antiterminator [Bacteroidota bacterium]MBT6686302.1 UpxY family transcription antiterminator [Bacteroidota bacterium]MBT7145104.1 UpxY family transcription antiterminator [Bacteroidota bacterium]MBT7490178.1 UpxY family transcription antiterminator [Bacteroidota bacterium]